MLRRTLPFVLPFLPLGLACGGTGDVAASAQDQSECTLVEQPLPIPPVLASSGQENGGAAYTLTSQEGTRTFDRCHQGPSFGYNGSYLGPTIRARRGDHVVVHLQNQMASSTTLHWHGLKVGPDVDISRPLAKGESATVEYTVDQQAATYWYHPHPHMDTGRQVYFGLAGLFLVDDDTTDALPLPKTYGVDDIPLVVQDRRFDKSGKPTYRDFEEDGDGMLGNVVLVNGASDPVAEVPANLVRLRILNASNARTYDFAFSDGRSFSQIASDGGLLAAPVAMTDLMLAPAERAEIVVDLSSMKGRTLKLLSRKFTPVTLPSHDPQPAGGNDAAGMDMGGMGGMGGMGDMPGMDMPGGGQKPHANDKDLPPLGTQLSVLTLRVGASKNLQTALPAVLTTIPPADPSQAVNAASPRKFGLEDTGDMVINGKLLDMNRVDEHVHRGDTEIWEIKNDATDLMHPFHVHTGAFRILSRSGGDVAENERGWKDVVRVDPGETVRILMTFDAPQGRYMYHCHILEHEDAGMMGVFALEDAP